MFPPTEECSVVKTVWNVKSEGPMCPLFLLTEKAGLEWHVVVFYRAVTEDLINISVRPMAIKWQVWLIVLFLLCNGMFWFILPTLFECKEGKEGRRVRTVSGVDKLKEWKMNMWRRREADKGIKGRRNGMKDKDMKEVVCHWIVLLINAKELNVVSY